MDNIYEAGINPEVWTSVLEELCDMTDAISVGIFIENYQENTIKVAYAHGIPRLVQKIYNAGLAKFDPGYKRMENIPLGRSSNILDLKYPEQPFFQKMILKPAGIGYLVAMKILDDKDDLYISIGLHRSPKAVAFEKDKLDFLDNLLPHLQRSFRIQRQFTRLHQKQQTLMHALSETPFGILLLDESGRPDYINEVAQQILEHHPAISLSPKGVTARAIALRNQQKPT